MVWGVGEKEHLYVTLVRKCRHICCPDQIPCKTLIQLARDASINCLSNWVIYWVFYKSQVIGQARNVFIDISLRKRLCCLFIFTVYADEQKKVNDLLYCTLQGGLEEANKELYGYGLSEFFKDDSIWKNLPLLWGLSSFKVKLNSFFWVSISLQAFWLSSKIISVKTKFDSVRSHASFFLRVSL